MLFVHLRVALDGIVFDALRDLAQIGDCFVFQFLECSTPWRLL